MIHAAASVVVLSESSLVDVQAGAGTVGDADAAELMIIFLVHSPLRVRSAFGTSCPGL